MILNINLQEGQKEPFQNETDELTEQNQNSKFTTNYRLEVPKNLKNEVLLLMDETSTFKVQNIFKTMQLEQERQQSLHNYFERKKDFDYFHQPNAQSIISSLQQRQICSNFDTLVNQNIDPFADRQKMIMQQLMSVKKIYCHLSTDEDTYYTSRIYDIYFTENQKYFIASSTNGQIKIFETETLKLKRTLKGNKKEITMIVCDQQNKVLCFTDGETVFAYDFQTYARLCLLDVEGVNEFTCMDLYTKDGQTLLFLSDVKYGFFLFRLTEDNEFTQVMTATLEASHVKQFEFDKKNLCLYTYRRNYIDLWDVKSFIEKKSCCFTPHASYCTNQKGQNFHLSVDMNSVFITYDRTYHAICKLESEKGCKELLKQKYKKINFTQKERNQAICNNKNFSIIAVNTFQKGEDEDEFEQPTYELYIYANINSEDVQLLDHISQENNPTVLQLNDSVCVISSNPVYSNIFLLGLSEGNLIILDIESLQVLQIISENCDHLNQPAVKNPVLEAQFLSNGMEVMTGTYFGSISLYSIDLQQQHRFQNADQQFFLNDYTLESDIDQGRLCDSNMNIYDQFESTNLDEIYEHFYKMNVENIVSQILKKDEVQKKEFETEMKQQKENLKQRFNIQEKPKVVKLYDYQTQQQVQNDKKYDESNKLDESISAKSSGDSISYKKLNRRSRRYQFMEEQEGHKLKSQRLRNKNFKIEESNDEIEEKEDFINDSSNEEEIQSSKSPKKERRRSQRVENQTNEQQQIKKEPEYKCSFCKELCEQYNQCTFCNEKYCESCAFKLFFVYTRNLERCRICYFKIIKSKYDYVDRWISFWRDDVPSRFYFDIEMQNFIEDDSQVLIFKPQIGECYYFIPEAFLYFFQTYTNHFYYEWALENIKKLLLFKEDFCIKIKDYTYEFPQIKTQADMKLTKDYLITQKIIALVDSDAPEQVKNILGDKLEIEFYFSYTENTDMLFLIPKNIYSYCQNNIKNLKNNSVIAYKNQDVFLNKIILGQSLYNSIEFLEMQEGKNLRRKQFQEKQMGHPWFITTFVDQAPVEQKLIKNSILHKEIQLFIQENHLKYQAFIEQVDKEHYKDYLDYVQVEMYLKFIEERLQNNFYYSKESLFKDIELIEQNCKKYNESESDISKLSEQLVQDLKNLIENVIKSRKYGRPLVVERNNQLNDTTLLTKKLSRV